MSETGTRKQIIEAADRLFYHQGYEHTSFADIADAVHISRGNFYYHFKTKDDILAAVISLRLLRTENMLAQWQAEGKSPRDRIRSFVNILLMNRSKIKNYGCPVGTLCSELAKLEHDAQTDANKLFGLFHKWLRKQFVQLGYNKDAGKLAMHLLVMSQGVATLASAFNDEKFIKQQVKLINGWLDSVTQNHADS